MQTKLTLSLDQQVIEYAKEYAKQNKRSLSNIVEEYLKSLSDKSRRKRRGKTSGLVRELKGSVKLPDNSKAYKELLEDALIEKYLK